VQDMRDSVGIHSKAKQRAESTAGKKTESGKLRETDQDRALDDMFARRWGLQLAVSPASDAADRVWLPILDWLESLKLHRPHVKTKTIMIAPAVQPRHAFFHSAQILRRERLCNPHIGMS
jgi:hypothetical protein